ncbi:HAD family hydrolase [Pseudooceanicola sp.]|uniref:HAD family hydrolase n=1 Tax=Pseudooceanicola sp. TaxID=1914328 RepID=UPI0035179611
MDKRIGDPPTCHPVLDARHVAQARIVLCDLDGCLISEGRAFDEAPDFVAGCADRLWIVSNRSDMTAAALAQQLARMQLDIPRDRILLAGECALSHLAETGLNRLRLQAAEPLRKLAVEMGFELNHPLPQAVLLCRDPKLTVDGFGPLLNDLDRDIPLWIANEDLSHPGLDGRVVAETGALLAALRAIRPELGWHTVGKPDPYMLHHALDAAGIAPEAAIFLGDNPDTDGRAARRAGVPFLQIDRSLAR